jgi:hypothetical protein
MHRNYIKDITLRMSVHLFACSIHLLARLYFLYSARLTFGSLCSKLCSVFLSAALAQTQLFYLCLYFLFVFLFIFILFLRTGSASLPLRHVCANAVISRPRHRCRNEKEKRLFGVGWMNLF